MKECRNCGKEFASFCQDGNGKRIDCRKREYCLECNPVGQRNFWRGKRVGEDGSRFDLQEYNCKTCNRKFSNRTRNLECTTCVNKRVRNKRKAKGHEYLGGKCEICGYDKCIDAMDIHHVNSDDKSFQLSNSWQLKWETIEKELDKCVLLCCRCHRELHAGMHENFQNEFDKSKNDVIVKTSN